MYSCRFRTLSPPSDRNTTCWFSAIPCDFSGSHNRRRGLASNVWTKLKHLLEGFCSSSLRRNSMTLLPAMIADRYGVESVPSGEHLCQQPGYTAIGYQGGPLVLQVQQFRAGLSP